jgi:predicted esterase
MRLCTLLTVLLAALPSLSAGQVRLPVAAAYLDHVPVIDGRPDGRIAALPAIPLTLVSGQPPASLAEPSYRVAYTAQYLYLAVELEAERLEQRDRAYQNGDGLILVIARPRPDGDPTSEFLVLGFSPGVPAARWQQKFVWYRNVELEMRPLEDSSVATDTERGRAWFEVLLPWSELHPFHPWLSDGIGFNICVTRALPDGASARYCAVEDRRVDSEQSPRRYQLLPFAEPRPDASISAAAVPERNHVREDESLRLRLATLAPSRRQARALVRVLSGEGSRLASRQSTLEIAAGLGVHEIEVPVSGLPPGGYMVTWDLDDGAGAGRFGLSLLASPDAASLRERLSIVSGERLRPGSRSSLQFQIDEIESQERRLRPHDQAATLRMALDRLLSGLRDAEAGTDALAARTGILRRAFRSAVDGTLQPYSVRIPPGYDAKRRYPLLVYLHGSGEDDRNQLARAWLPDDFILLAPRARGTSNWYTRDHAQEDIREAIEDVMANYAIDGTRVVLAGFSMGGYGVYRTYMEDPLRYAALAVFSGLPRVPGSSPDAGHPDFLNTVDPAIFMRVPVFIFHGGQDRNCPVEETRALVRRLTEAGVRADFHCEEEKGHEAPGQATLDAFRAWLQKVTGKP